MVETPPAVEKPSILIVEDTPANITVLVEALRDQYALRIATSGEDALEVLKGELPDLILLDILMPGMDGYEVCRRLKEDPRTRSLSVIFITALTEVEEKSRGFELGAVDYITKPFEIAEVRARLRTHLTLKQAREALDAQNRHLSALSRNLAKYLSPQLYESIFSGKTEVRLETHRKTLTVFFSDIVGFTALAEQSEPETLTLLLNDYLTEMSEIALRHGGTIDKFIGDAILVFFGDPESRGVREDALACLAMAVEMREHLGRLRPRWAAQGATTPLRVRMGISTGYCTVGNFGSANRLEYTLIGSIVNLANRLQATADPDEILIAEQTHALVHEEFLTERKQTLTVKGFSRPVESYRVVDSLRNIACSSRRCEKRMEGLNLEVDVDRLPAERLEEAVEALRQALALLGEGGGRGPAGLALDSGVGRP